MSVNALSSRDPGVNSPATYILAPGQSGVTSGDLQFQEFAGYVERALARRGLSRTADPSKADLVVVMSYGVGDPQTFTQQVAVPVWGQTGIASMNTTGQLSGNTFKSTTTVNSTYGITGYSQMTSSQTFVIRNLKLTTYKKEDVVNASFNQLWMVSVASAGPTADLRLVLPYLVSAAVPYIGKSPGRLVSVSLPRNDQSTLALMAQ
jgi:hypothetical protein